MLQDTDTWDSFQKRKTSDSMTIYNLNDQELTWLTDLSQHSLLKADFF